MSLFALLFSFRGRINRAKYWFVLLINVIVSNVGWFLVAIASGLFNPPDRFSPTLFMSGMVALLIFSLWTGLAAGIKRLRDRGKSELWILVFAGAPAALAVIAWALSAGGMLFVIAAVAILLWALVELGCLKGTTGPNEFGADPREASIT